MKEYSFYVCFNTSHVTLYQLGSQSEGKKEKSFNTSHVTLYLLTGEEYIFPDRVSIHLMLLFIMSSMVIDATSASFNTSHVTLYQIRSSLLIFVAGFQYISCYSLSPPGLPDNSNDEVSIHLMLLFIVIMTPPPNLLVSFQYISCYSLSVEGERDDWKERAFQYISCYSLSLPGLL